MVRRSIGDFTPLGELGQGLVILHDGIGRALGTGSGRSPRIAPADSVLHDGVRQIGSDD